MPTKVDDLDSLAADSPCQLDVLRHDGHSLGVNGAQIGVLEQTDQVGLRCLLQGHDCRALEAKVGLEVLGNLTNESLEGQLANEKLGRLLVSTDLTKSDSSRSISVRLLYSACSRGTLAGGLRGQLFTWCLATSGFASCLLGSSHACLLACLIETCLKNVEIRSEHTSFET